MQLSRRLRTIIEMTGPAETAADIGTDHGFVPIALLSEGRAARCIAADIRKGPLARAREHLDDEGLSGRCSVRLGPGLSVLERDEADVIVIAGMGGLLIREILNEGREKLGKVKQLVLSPQTEVTAVRETVEALGFYIADEAMVEEDGKFYVVISAKKADGGHSGMTARELKYGPVLLAERPEAFLSYLRFRIRREEEILEKIRASESAENEAAAAAHEAELREIRGIIESTSSVSPSD